VCLILKEIFMHYHSDQRVLRGRKEDVALNIVGAFQEDAANKVTQLHSELTFIIIFTKYHRFCLGRIILFCCIYPRHLKGQSVKTLSDIKRVRGAKKAGDR